MGLLDEIVSGNKSERKDALDNSPGHTLTGRGAPEYQAPPATHRYDGLTGQECLEAFEANQREVPGDPKRRVLTAKQTCIASCLWSSRIIEKKIAADIERRSRETTVQITIDPEDM